MRRMNLRPPGGLSRRSVRQAGLLLALGASLAGFFLLLNLLVPLVSTGPQDILAVKPSDEDETSLPTGVALLTFGVMAVSIILGVGGLLVLRDWSLWREGGAPSMRLLPGLLVAVGLIGVGGYLAFSGILGQEILYEQHQVQRVLLQPAGLVVLAGFFLSVAIAGILNPRLLLPVLAGWLTVGIILGFLNTQPLDGLRLFERPSRLEEPVEYSAIVERYLRPDEVVGVDAEGPLSPNLDPVGTELAPAAAPRTPEGPYMSLDPGLTTAQTPRLAHEPVFLVTGAANTSYLRAATGDLYANGAWAQVDPVHIPTHAEERVPGLVASFVSRIASMQESGESSFSLNMALLRPPTSTPPAVAEDLIAVSPAGEIVGFVAGPLAISQSVRSIQVDVTYRPFSATVSVDHALTNYRWKSSVPTYSPDALIGAPPIDDPTYLQLPEDLPRRIHDLAAEIATEESAYLRARAIEEYLKENYTFAFALPGSAPVRPPAGQDPVDWFLFDHGEGSHGNFSTAFVVLARAAGVPARVVSGWAISPGQEQTVHWDQAHQWAEVALEGLGWITFDPSPPQSLGDGAPLGDKAPLEEDKAPLEEDEVPLEEEAEDGALPQVQESAPKKEPVTEEAIEAALEDLVANEDPEVRLFVLEVLGESTDPEALRKLVEVLVDEGYVADELIGIEKLQALDVGLLIWVLLNYEQPVIRAAAADALGKLGDIEALDALSQALASDLVPEVRTVAADALAELGDPAAFAPLVRALASDGDGMVRAAAAQALGELKAPGTAEVLIKALGADPDERVRAAAAWGLGQVRDEAALAPLLEAEKHDDLRAVREAARDALSEWPTFSLVAALQGSPHPEARAAAAEIIGRLGYVSAIPALSGALGDQEEAIRSAALEALRRLGTLLPLENGGALLIRGQSELAFIPGATADAAPEGPVRAAFNVAGAARTTLLRTATGDHYVEGRWISGETAGAPHRGREVDHTPALARPGEVASSSEELRVSVSDSVSSGRLLAGTVPTSSYLRTVSLPGAFWPESGVFNTSVSTRQYSWTSWIHDYAAEELEASRTVPSEQHTSLPDDLPQRVRDLAVEITARHSGPYRKAAAIEEYLRENYRYEQPDIDREGPPEGHDPVDWFLFESGAGTSGNFSSAFVVLARSVGIPARVVSGWAIAPIAGSQEVYSDQAHQWAEVPFEDRGWIGFDPTPGGAPLRAFERLGSSHPGLRAAAIKGQLEQLAGSDAAAKATARELLDALLESAHGRYPSVLQDLSAAALSVSREAEALGLLDDLLRSLSRQNAGHTPLTLASLEALSRELAGLERGTREPALSALAELLEALSSDRPTAPAGAREAFVDLLALLSESGSTIRLENGGLLIRQGRGGGQGFTWSFVGTTTLQSTGLPHIPVFEVRGAANTVRLRTSVGDVYEHGRWAQQDPVSVPYPAGGSTYDLLRDIFYTPARDTLSLPSGPFEPALLFGPQTPAARTVEDRIEVLPTGNATRLPAGTVPTSRTMQRGDRTGVLYPYSATFYSERVVASYSWVASVSTYSDQQLASANAVHGLAYTDLPDDLPDRIRALAQRITAGQATAYGKAKALERYVSTQYVYRLARTPEEARPPPGRDPVDWFLFDHREGTCGVFSSAFVVLARSIGLPARVVAGWVITPTDDRQVVYANQAHQWAEVAFEGLGWVSFEPTGSGGAPSRVEGRSDDTSSEDTTQSEDTIRLENGGVLTVRDERQGGGDIRFSGGTSTLQATEPPLIPIFKVRGAANTPYLRVAVGEVYEDGRWREQETATIPYTAGSSVQDRLQEAYYSPGSGGLQLPSGPFDPALLFGPQTAPISTARDRIVVLPLESSSRLLPGRVPTSRTVQSLDRTAVMHPLSATFSSETTVASYSWVSMVPSYSNEQLTRANAVYGLAHTDLPNDLPDRIRALAERITAGQATAYGKAKALERYLSTRYTYRFARTPEEARPPPGRDPVDWFLFDHREGTCGVFSSAFAVLARSIGLPARVVSGWLIAPTADTQTVFVGQAHQWAEVAFEGVGWVRFEPTGSGGAPSRVQDRFYNTGDGGEYIVEVPEPPRDTVTNISQSPAEISRGKQFTVRGTVHTTAGVPVSGVTVEVYVNETKDHGGTKIGTAVTRFGGFQASAEIPTGLKLGSYQLLARAVANEDFNGSWSDPDITVFSASGLELTGPAEVPVDVEAVFHGRVTDDTGAGVADRHVSVTVDGQARPRVTTGPTGSFSLSMNFSDPGRHWVAVELEGQEYLLDNQVRLDFQVTLPTSITLLVPALVSVSEGFTVTGELRDARGTPLSGEFVSLTVGDNAAIRTLTDRSGVFQVDSRVNTAGEFVIHAEFSGLAPTLPSEKTTRLTARHTVSLSLSGPSQIDTGSSALFTGRLTSDTLSPIGELEISIEDGDGSHLATVTTDEDGRFEYNHASFDIAGPQSLAARFAGGEFVAPRSARVNFGVVSPTTLNVEGPLIQRDGESLEPAGLLIQGTGAVFTGRLTSETVSPIGRRELTIRDGEGLELAKVTTTEDGFFEYRHPSFDVAGLHSLTFRFPGTESLAPQSSGINFGVLAPTTLSIEEPTIVSLGGPSQLAGFLLQGSGALLTGRLASETVMPIGRQELSIGDADGRKLATVTTTEDGAFEYNHPAFETTGPHAFTVEFSGAESLAPQSAGITFEVLAPTTLTIEEPTIVRSGEPSQLAGFLLQGSGAVFTGRLASDTVSPIGRQELSIRDADGRKLATVTTTEDGAFEYSHPAFETTGPHAFTVEFSGAESLAPQSEGITFGVLAPTVLTIAELGVVQSGRPFELTGVLLRSDGRPVPEATVRVRGRESSVLVTDASGAFTWEATETLRDSSSGATFESKRDVEFVFEGTDHLAPATAGTKVTVGAPRIVMDPAESVARGDSVLLRGTALVGTYPVPGVEVSIGGVATVSTNQAGAFGYSYPVAEDSPLGTTQVDIAAAGIDAATTTAVEVRSAPSLIVTPLDKVRPGRMALLRVTLVDDTGAGIARAPLRSSQGARAVTDAEGMALMDLTVPETHELPSVPVTFEYDGDDLNMPLSYFLGVPVTPGGFNWLLWAGAPVAILLVVAAALAARRVESVSLPVSVRQRLAALAPAREPVAAPVADAEETTEEEEIDERLPAQLAIRFIKPADDLPDVLGIGEEVGIEIGIADPEGQSMGRTTVEVSVPGEEGATHLVTDSKGKCALRWTARDLGEYVVSATFPGDDKCLEASETRLLRVVDFREEIVRLYNEFLDWAESRTTAISEQSTPREVELTLVAEGLGVDQKSLDELISRFEEADYSEHPIARGHYERMYRAWHTVVRG